MWNRVQWPALLMAILLSGCGGSSGGSLVFDDGTGDDTDPEPTEPVSTVEISLWDCDSYDISDPSISDCSETNEVRETPTTVVYVVAKEGGREASGVKVTVDTDKGNLSVSDGSVLTNSNGQGYMTLAPGEDTGVVTLTANYSDADSAEVIATIFGAPTTSDKTIDVSLWDCPPSQSGCMEIDDFSSASPALIIVKATSDQQPATKAKVVVTADKGTLSPSDGVALTDDEGMAYIDISAGVDSGIVTISGTYDDASDEVLATINEVKINLELTSTLAPGDELADGSTLPITATLTTDDGEPYLSPVEVTFTSQCVASDKAELDDSILATNGTAQATYKSAGCEAEDVITASVTLGSSSDTQQLLIPIAVTLAGNIEFVSAAPELINLQGTGGQTSSVVTFKVTDSSQNVKQGQQVNFSLASGEDKVELNVMSAISNNDGEVTVTVTSKSLPGSARIQAEVDGSDPIITAVSSVLAIATGLPDADSFSISFDTVNPNAWSTDGVPVVVTVRVADHFNNPVPDDTSISFIAEGGSIQPACKTSGGKCSVTWESADPRPLDARVTVLAFVEGEESFYDLDGDGLYTEGTDTFVAYYDLGEAYRDDNENGVYDDVDQLIDRNKDRIYNGPNGIYDGLLCSDASSATGGCNKSLVDVTSLGANVIVMAGNSPEAYFCANDGSDVDCSGGPSGAPSTQASNIDRVYVCIRDRAPDGTYNPVAQDSTISFRAGSGSDLVVEAPSNFVQGFTNNAIYHDFLGIDDTQSCGDGLYSVLINTDEGLGSVIVELGTGENPISSSISIVAP
ncbi:invasin domain 3-containing protein [Echinimonas agarilytica]|uniref:Invasin domain-containing protein n=1 Tax=Echinimonas agarilytica TaxID=1215918 RepID=A0AA41W6F9_9GAMM|nr:invasin domain 3-containing protein [Echinimonas agarilytica]MCM2679759.1 hypothetical protein [Echinimonas agarilytica]